MTQSMNAENAKKNQKLTISNREMYEKAKKKVEVIERYVDDKVKYLKRIKYIDPKTGSEISTKTSLLGIKKGTKMIFGTDKIEDK